MSEEEKEAIEYIKAFQKDLYGAIEKNLMAIYIDRVWNYIDKLQKEVEEIDTFCSNQLAFRDRLKRGKEEITPFNNGRFCMSEQILEIIKKAKE